jgi:hypothetical protein
MHTHSIATAINCSRAHRARSSIWQPTHLRNICFLLVCGLAGRRRPTQLAAQAKLVKSGPKESLKRTALLALPGGQKWSKLLPGVTSEWSASKSMHQILKQNLSAGLFLILGDVILVQNLHGTCGDLRIRENTKRIFSLC